MIKDYAARLKNLEIDKVWMNRTDNCPRGVIGIEWSCSEIGFGRYELIVRGDGKIAAETECMDSQDDLRFTNAILDAFKNYVIKNIVVEE
jgi:hypothetical protein